VQLAQTDLNHVKQLENWNMEALEATEQLQRLIEIDRKKEKALFAGKFCEQ
jgi:hypothetical protein